MASTITLNQVFEQLNRIERNMLTKNEIGAILETLEIISNEHTMRQIKQSEEDIRQGRVKEINSVSDI